MDSKEGQGPVRLNKFLAQHLNLGRRAADELIAKAAVKVNGQPPRLGAQIMPGDVVEFKGKAIKAGGPAQFLYVLFNKPAGYVCSRRQQGATPTIYSLLPPQYQHLKTVGRLDKDSSGIILLTNDGDTAHRLTHPSFAKLKKYEVTLDKPLEPLHRQMIAEIGVNLPDGPSKLGLERLAEKDETAWQVTMREGRNRQIRRTFTALGYTITRLHRTQFGPYSLHDLNGKKMSPVTPVS